MGEVDTWVAILAFVVPTSAYLLEKFGKRAGDDALTKARLDALEQGMATYRLEMRQDRTDFRADIAKLFGSIDKLTQEVTRLVTIEEQRAHARQA